MDKAKNGDTVKVSYIGTLEDGKVFDQSKGDEYLKFTIGHKEVIPGFEDAVLGMKIGETKKVAIPHDQAYGTYDQNNVLKVTRSRLPDDVELKIGMQLQAKNSQGNPITVTITELDKNTVTLDGNHPLVEKDLTFEITLKEIV